MTRAYLRLLAAGMLAVCAQADAAQIVAGTSERELTPSVKTPLAGYSRRHGKPATGVHDPLFVRAVVIQDGEQAFALVSCDLLIIDERLFDAVRQRLDQTPAGTSLTVLLAATHTHSGPGAYGRKFLEQVSMGHYDQRVFEELVARITETIRAASERLQPVSVRYAGAPVEDAVLNRMTKDGPVDDELGVVALERADHQPVAILVSFAAHPTTLGSKNMELSADYPGVLVRRLQAAHPSAAVLFLPGAAGDQGPVKRGEGFEATERLGTLLAQRAEALLAQPGSPPPAGSSTGATDGVRAIQRVVPLAPARLRIGGWTAPRVIGRSLVDDDATLTVARAGPVMFLGVPCDFSAELGLELKRYAADKGFQPVVVGFSNDYVGYCLPSRLYTDKSYESSMAFNGPMTGEQLVRELEAMIDESQ